MARTGSDEAQAVRRGRAPRKAAFVVAAIFAALLLICSGIALAAGDETPEGSGQSEALSPPSSDEPGVELQADRTATSQTFELPDGAHETRLYEAPINYRDAEGEWKPIGEGLEEAGGGALTNGPNRFDASLPNRLGEGPMRLSVGDQWVSTELLGDSSQPAQLEDQEASYGLSGGAAVDYAGVPNGIKESIEIAGPNDPSSFKFALDASAGLHPVLSEEGAVEFRDESAHVIATLPAPFMYDSATPAPAESSPIHSQIHYELEPGSAGSWILTVVADRDWLSSPERVWPVYLDPSTTVPTPSLDCFYGLYGTATTYSGCGSGGTPRLRAQYKPATSEQTQERERSLLKFDTSSIPSNAYISEATLGLFAPWEPSHITGVEVRRATKGWDKNVSWFKFDGTQSWTAAGGDFTSEGSEILTSERTKLEGWWNFSKGLAPLVEGWVSGKIANQGLLVKLKNEEGCQPPSCTDSWASFNSSATTETGTRPYLSVTYSTPPTVLAKSATSVKETEATLNAGVNPNGLATTYQFEYGTTTAYGKVAPATAKEIGSGKTEVSVSEPLSGLSPNTAYHFRISASNAVGKTVSEDKVFTTLKLPTATTEAATGVKGTEATLRASINPNGSATMYQFEYGPTTSYGTTSPTTAISIGSGSSPVAVTRLISGLAEGSTYHFRVKATNEVGVAYGADKTLTTQDPPETTITSAKPSYTAGELSSVIFTSDQAGSTFKCSLDDPKEEAKTACTSPYSLPSNLGSGWHTFVVTATNKAGNTDPTPAKWKFNLGYYPKAPATSKVTSPEEGEVTASYYTLKAEWGSAPEGGGVTGVTFQVEFPAELNAKFKNVPANCVTGEQGQSISWPLPVTSNPGHTESLYLKVPGCSLFKEAGYPEKHIKLRAVFDGGINAAGVSEAVSIEFNEVAGGPKDVTESIGPVTLDLLTGAYTLSRTDVSIPVPGSEASLEFTRVYESANILEERGKTQVLGGMWQPSAPVEQAYPAEAWSALRERHEAKVEKVVDQECIGEGFSEEECLVQPEIPEANWIEIVDNEGAALIFEIVNGSYIAPEYAKEYVLTKQGNTFTLATPEGTRTVFTQTTAGTVEYWPKSVSWQANPKASRMVYESTGASERLSMMVAPSALGVTCEESEGPNYALTTPGCRTLTFQYKHLSELGGSGTEERLASITYYNATGKNQQVMVRYAYNSKGNLSEEWDPRISPALKETYSYKFNSASEKLLETVAPPGEEPWEFGYTTGTASFQKLKTMTRNSLLESPSVARTTIEYNVGIETGMGSYAPYAMGPASVAKWGQSDFPVNATAIKPPLSGSGSEEYSNATVKYMDPSGYLVNTTSPEMPGASGPSIETTERDSHGNIVRSLSPQNRLLALAAGAGSAVRSHELDSHSTYSADGTEMLESWGPLHKVRLESGEMADARAHTKVEYDKDFELKAGETAPRLPTKETTAASVAGKGELEQKVSETRYNWELRKPIETIVDPSGLNIRSITEYEKGTGLPIETRQPKNSAGGGAGTTRIVYYTDAANPEFSTCGGKERDAWANLPCKVLPAAQASPAEGNPKLLVKRVAKYSSLDEPEEVIESPGGAEEAGKTRTTTMTYDIVGRPLTKKIEGGGTAIPKTETLYNPTTGRPETQRFVCDECGPAGTFQSAFGSAGTGNGQFNHPADVAADAKGNLWTLDKGNNRIEEFNEKGEFLRKAGSEGSTGGKLKSPSALAVDPSGNVWVADTANNRIEEFNETGAFVAAVGKDVNKTKVEAAGTEAERNYCSAASGNVCQAGPEGTAAGQLKAPQGIAATSGGNLWVADTGHSRMEKYTPTGGLLNNSFGNGSGVGQLNEPTAVAMGPGGSLWVADTGNSRIEHWDSSLNNPAVFGTEGTANGQFKHPDALEVEASGKVWVGDEGNSRVEEFTEKGEFLGKFGSAGSGAGQFSFSAPIGIAVESKGNVWVTDAGNNRVQKWTPTNAFDTQATTTTYDALGRVTKYEDADGNVATTTYDVNGRPVTHADAKGSQAVTYDPISGVPTKLEDSAAGTFTASYDADGNMLERGLPNGLTVKTTYNEAGEPTKLAYTKAASCGESCTWFEEGLERSIYGQILSASGSLATQQYSYDKAGRLKQAQETPKGGSCTTRAYSYDADSNRTELTTREPGIGGACATSGGTTQKYEYDSADRLLGTGLTYDNFGRITSLPAADAGGKALTTEYFSTNMVAKQTQNGVTNEFQLDASLRQRQRIQGGGLEGTEVFHYDGGSDSPVWTQLGSTWIRPITGIGGELAAIQDSSSGTTFQLTNLHGDVVATASSSPAATKLLATFRFDEFGNPVSGSAGRFGWLGGKQRRAELPSGVIQMGARSYVPAIGRFLTPDPIPGGSANAYDYANQDPVNAFDLEGTCSSKSKRGCRAALRKAAKKVRESIRSLKATVRQKRAESTRGLPGVEGVHFPRLPWEDDVNDAMKKATNALVFIDEATSCSNSSVVVGGTGTILERRGGGLVGEAGMKIAGGVTKLGSRLTDAGVILGILGVFGVC